MDNITWLQSSEPRPTDWRLLNAPFLKSCLDDSTDHVVLSETPMLGNKIDALPYSYEITEVNTPGWQAEVESKRIYNPKGSAYYRYKGDGITFTGIQRIDFELNKIVKSERDKVDSIAIVKAQAKLTKAAASLPMLYAERKATAKTIKLYSKGILNNVITMQRKDVKKWLVALKRHKNNPERLKKIARDIANRHLEFVFGVLPLIEDIKGLCEELTKDEFKVRTGRGKHTVIDKTVTVRDNQYGFSTTTIKTFRYSVRTNLRCDIDASVLNDASLLGFNAVYAWYDFTPLSFVVGWFSNLNHWLQSLDPNFGLTYRTGSSSKRNEVVVEKSCTGKASTTNKAGSGNGQGFGKYYVQNREVHSSEPPLQGIYLMDNTSLFAAFASASLLVQRYVKNAEREIARKPFQLRSRRRPKYLPPINYR